MSPFNFWAQAVKKRVSEEKLKAPFQSASLKKSDSSLISTIEPERNNQLDEGGMDSRG